MSLVLGVLDLTYDRQLLTRGEATETQEICLIFDFFADVFQCNETLSIDIPDEINRILDDEPHRFLDASFLINKLQQVGTDRSKAAARGITNFISPDHACCMLCYTTSVSRLRQSQCCGAVYCQDCLYSIRLSYDSICSFCQRRDLVTLFPPVGILRIQPDAAVPDLSRKTRKREAREAQKSRKARRQ